MTLLLRHCQQGAKNWDKDRCWQDASLTTPQICAERSWQGSLPNPPPEEALTPAISPFAPKRLQCCSIALLFHTQPAGTGMLVTSPRQEYNQLQKD